MLFGCRIYLINPSDYSKFAHTFYQGNNLRVGFNKNVGGI